MKETAFRVILVEFRMIQSRGFCWVISPPPLSSRALYDRKSMNPSKTQQHLVRFVFSTPTTVGACAPPPRLETGSMPK